MFTKILALAALFAVATAQYAQIGLANHGHEIIKEYYAPANYEFKYGVSDPHTGDEKQQSEIRKGDTVQGEYSLREADGTIRIVKYTADPHNGFNAIVERKGHAAHPQQLIKKIIATPKLISSPIISTGYSSGNIGYSSGGHGAISSISGGLGLGSIGLGHGGLGLGNGGLGLGSIGLGRSNGLGHGGLGLGNGGLRLGSIGLGNGGLGLGNGGLGLGLGGHGGIGGLGLGRNNGLGLGGLGLGRY